MEWSPRGNQSAKFCVNRLRSFLAAVPRKWPFPILFRTTLTTVLHYRADCDIQFELASRSYALVKLVNSQFTSKQR